MKITPLVKTAAGFKRIIHTVAANLGQVNYLLSGIKFITHILIHKFKDVLPQNH
jgi:hypothetical protein